MNNMSAADFLEKHHPILVVALLTLVMFATRMEHFGSAVSLPDASLAVFFFAGLWVAQRRGLLWLLGVAAATDYLAVTQSGISGSCFTPAYPFLAPAYACLWVAGERARAQAANAIVRPFAGAVLAAVSAFAISSLSFFAFSGEFAVMGVVEYVTRTARYAPSYVLCASLYVAFGLAIRAMLSRQATAAVRQRVA